MGHRKRRMAFLAHAERHVQVRFCRPRHGIHFGCYVTAATGGLEVFVDKRFVYIPRHFISPHPKGVYLYLMYGLFVWIAIRAAHGKLSARYGLHRKTERRTCQLLCIGFDIFLGCGSIQQKYARKKNGFDSHLSYNHKNWWLNLLPFCVNPKIRRFNFSNRTMLTTASFERYSHKTAV